MRYDGRVIATVGSSTKKEGALSWDRSYNSVLQPGSSIKPVVVYPYAIESKKLYFSSMVLDEPLDNYRTNESGQLVSGPNNAYGYYNGNMSLPDAIEWSSNATAAQTMELIGGPSVAYQQVITKMGFKNLTEQDAQNTGALSIGGMNGGVTVREMAAAYTYLGNGGLYYEPYTYYYVTDSEDNIIIDNRDAVPKQAYSAETAGIMNRLLHYNVTNSAHTNAHYAQISGWDIIGKTGTTDDDKDSWFCGCSPYAVMATWCGFDKPETISYSGRTTATKFFANVMGKYLEGKENKEYKISDNLIEATYNPTTGLIVSTDNISGRYVGYYTEDNMPSSGGSYYSGNYEYGSDVSDSSSYYDPNYGGDNSGNNYGGDTSNSGGDNSGGDTSGGGDNSGGESSGGGEEAPPAAE